MRVFSLVDKLNNKIQVVIYISIALLVKDMPDFILIRHKVFFRKQMVSAS